MMRTNRIVTLMIGVGLGLSAYATEPAKTDANVAAAGLKVAVDKDGKVRQFTAEDEQALNLNKPETMSLLSKRLSAPKVSVVRKLKGGTTMAEIGLDQVDYLVVKADDTGVPQVLHRSNAQQNVLAEEK